MKKNERGPWPAAQVEMRKLEKIKPYPQNPMTHPPAQVEQLARDMRDDGVTMPILVDEKGVIIAGHGRRLAAIANKFTEYPVVVARGWTETQKRAVRLKDNQISRLGVWDQGLVRGELGALKLAGFDVQLIGFTDTQLRAFESLPPSDTDEGGAIPPTPVKPVSKPGDVWLCGRHRILCGDCREPEDVARALGGRKIGLGVTSPPYAEQRDYDEASGFKAIPPDRYVEWFKPVAANVAAHLAEGASWFVNIKPSAAGLDTSLYVMDLVIAHAREWGWHFATEFCWERVGVPRAVDSRFKNQFEPIYQFARGAWKIRPEAVRHESKSVPIPGPEKKKGVNTSNLQGSDWQKVGALGFPDEQIGAGLAYPGNRLPPLTGTHEALGHAAAFPVGVPAFFIKAYTDPGDVVFDPFMGSGSTLMAADQTGRPCVGIELSPFYVDVIIERWAKASVQEPTLESTGQKLSAVRRRRGNDGTVSAKDNAARVSKKDVHRSLSEPREPNGAPVGMRKGRARQNGKGGTKAAPSPKIAPVASATRPDSGSRRPRSSPS